jgi:hypothetical protein
MSVSVTPSVLILTVPLAGSGSSGFIEMFVVHHERLSGHLYSAQEK